MVQKNKWYIQIWRAIWIIPVFVTLMLYVLVLTVFYLSFEEAVNMVCIIYEDEDD